MSRRRGNGQGTLFRRKSSGTWIAQWYTHDGRRIEKSTGTTDRRAAERILARRVADEALRRDGVIDPRDDRFAAEARRPLADHIRDYIAHCRNIGQATRAVDQKERHLGRLREAVSAERLGDLTAERLASYMAKLLDDGLSARSANFARQIAVAFCGWCVKTSRAPSNPLRVVPKLDERKDRRRIRRPLADAELTSLLDVAEGRGRKAWYLAAALAGLRKGDLQRLIWADVDFEAATITVRAGKARRVDQIPLHPDLAAELRRLRSERRATAKVKVFPETVTDRTRLLDFLRAGIAREEPVVDAQGKPVMVGKRKPRPLMRIVAEDEEGRVIDLHALRTTLGTKLARAGVAPQIAQKIMRHGNYRTTLEHYTVLGLTDTAGALAGVRFDSPEIQRAAATGTDGATCAPSRIDANNMGPSSRPSSGGTNRLDSVRPDAATAGGSEWSEAPRNSRQDADLCGSVQGDAGKRANGLEPSTFSLEG